MEKSNPNDESESDRTTETREGSADGGGLNRRSYLKLGAATAGLLAGCSGAINGYGDAGQGDAAALADDVQFGYGGAPLASSTGMLAAAVASSEQEPNDTRVEATLIGMNSEVSGHLDAGEVDWFAFDAAGGKQYTVEFDRADAAGVSVVALYDGDGDFLNQVYVGTGDATTLAETPDADVRRYVEIADVEDSASDYTLTVTDGSSTTTTSTATTTETATTTATATTTQTATTTTIEDEYGEQNYGEYGYGGVSG